MRFAQELRAEDSEFALGAGDRLYAVAMADVSQP